MGMMTPALAEAPRSILVAARAALDGTVAASTGEDYLTLADRLETAARRLRAVAGTTPADR